MTTPDPLPSDAPPGRTRTQRPTGAKKWWPLALIAAVVVVALVLFLTPLLQNDGTPAATESTPASPTATPTPTVTPTKELPPAPEVAYYDQIGTPAGSPLTPVEPMSVKVSKELTGTTLPTGLTGISLEATDLADEDLSATSPTMVKLLNDLDKPVLRFGGNAVDRRFLWTSTGEAVQYSGDKTHPARAVGPADLQRVNTLLDATGAKISLTVDLGHYDPARAADFMKNATAIFGDKLLAVTIGNEPNGYVFNDVRTDGYSIEQYVTELKAYATAIHEVAPDLPIAGPGAYDQKWWQPFIDADIPQKKIFTFHNYPLYSCDAGDPKASPTLANLMTEQMHARGNDYQTAALEAGKTAGLETWLPETGIAACPGSNETSKTHASALWTADYALNAARLGITKMGFHSSMLTCKGGPPMSVLCSAGPYPQGNGVMSGRANFFGMSILSGLAGGKYLDLEQKGGGLSFTYALQNEDGSTSVVIVNENDPTVSAQSEITITLPDRALTGTMSQMTGPSYDAQDATAIDATDARPVPVAERPTVPGFAYGSAEQDIKITPGTVTVLNFTY